MIEFNPKLCPCGCKKWIMSPWFNCQCSSLSTTEKDEFMEIVRDAIRYREIRQHVVNVQFAQSNYVGQSQLDMIVDIMVITRKSAEEKT
jgi:hypothetical protein